MSFPEHLQHLICNDEPLAPYTWLRIGGPARYFAEPTSREELIDLVQAAHAAEIPIRVLGGGSNLLVRESGFSGLVLSLSAASLGEIRVEETQLTAGGGARLSHVVTMAVGKGLAGMGHLIGIPGTVGGALQGNASAGGSDIGQCTESVELLSLAGEISTRNRDEMQFSYRHSDLGDSIVLSASFQLEAGDPIELTKRMQKLWIVRRSERPRDEPRVITPFIDPDGATASDLIEQAGLKGIRQGAVSLDPLRPKYLVASDGASSDDVLALIDIVRDKVSLQTGIDLQMNLKIW
ncbi:UDP-N-acetylmuramate dehydrogenase [Rosistilla oblonga]|uniref:UDP-N-acetylmuramate dehydrogenase n=1 Tax=Rosistilla oblonga TaxID=2527990 RepID=UPI003A97010B